MILAGMALFALPRWFHGGAAVAPVALAMPAASLLNLNLLGKMGFGAFCGFDGAAIFSGECRDPNVARTIRRSIWLAAPIIALIYILGTACLLVFTPPKDLDLISPAMQMLSRGAQGTGIAVFVAPVLAALLIGRILGQSSIYYNAVIRLPMVAGWDHLLPAWLSRLHPRFKTPVGSILFIGLTTFGLVILGNLGVGAQEALPVGLQRRHHLLGTYIPGDVRHSAGGARREAFVGRSSRGRFRIPDDAVIHDPVDFPGH